MIPAKCFQLQLWLLQLTQAGVFLPLSTSHFFNFHSHSIVSSPLPAYILPSSFSSQQHSPISQSRLLLFPFPHFTISHSQPLFSPFPPFLQFSSSLIIFLCSICFRCKSSLSLTPVAGVASFPVHRRDDGAEGESRDVEGKKHPNFFAPLHWNCMSVRVLGSKGA